MGEEHFIETNFDVLLSTLKGANKPLSAGRLASVCGMREREVVKWLHVLEKSGQVQIENRFNGIHVSWIGEVEEKKSAPAVSQTAIDVGGQASFESDLKFAHQREEDAVSSGASLKKKVISSISNSERASKSAPAAKNTLTTKNPPAAKSAPADKIKVIAAKKAVSIASAVDVGDARIKRVDKLISELKSRRAEKKENLVDAIAREASAEDEMKENIVESGKREKSEKEENTINAAEREEIEREENLIDTIKREARESEETIATEISPKPDIEHGLLEENDESSKVNELGFDEYSGKEAAKDGTLDIEKEARKLVPDAQARENWKQSQAREDESAERESARSGKIVPRGRIGVPRERISVQMKGGIIPKFRYAGVKPAKIEKIKMPAPVEITGVTLQFSERIERQMKRIERQAREIDSLRHEKEKLLAEHYLPLQNRLESELETISDRVLHVQSKVAGLQKNAADLPAQISSVEKVQISSIKAHGEMRRAYDEACALLEESSKQLSEEREKMELILDQSREELSRHSSMSGELHNTMERIEEMEGEAASRVSTARAALAEQAERLASAETHANGLRDLRGEIGESILEMKREVASAKRVLTDLERQMGQMRQIEEYTNTIRKDYDSKMLGIDDYIRNGNSEFETLRESVEANFVRRYLRELRALTESYSFEFGQAKKMESDIDARISDERAKLELLFEEGKKISYLFETQSRAPENAEKFESHSETFTALSDISHNRSQVAQMIAQVIGGRTENLPTRTQFAASAKKSAEPSPVGITRLRKVVAKTKVRSRAPKRKVSASAGNSPSAKRLMMAKAARAPTSKAKTAKAKPSRKPKSTPTQARKQISAPAARKRNAKKAKPSVKARASKKSKTRS